MPRSIWKGSIAFGLVNIPVGLYAAEERKEIQFHLLDGRDRSPIHYQRISEKTGKEVPWEDTVRAFEYEEGRYVVLSDEDLKRANPEATQTVDILDFVEAEEISPLYFDKPYYLGPDKKGAKSYALLHEVLKKTGKVGIGKVVIRTRQYLAAVVPEGDILVLNLLRFAHELRDAAEIEAPRGRTGVTDRELEMARRLVEEMTSPWDPEKYRDDYEKDLMKLIEKRAQSGDKAKAPAPVPRRRESNVVDLMALLQKSIQGKPGTAKPAKAPREKAKTEKAKPRQAKTAAKARPKPAARSHRSAARKTA